jgi:hypothetical protein
MSQMFDDFVQPFLPILLRSKKFFRFSSSSGSLLFFFLVFFVVVVGGFTIKERFLERFVLFVVVVVVSIWY